ncbi:MAG: sulfurtransferase-like selenium metabolism protein YedF [Synergistota bacterium]|nr:sulfurtransferase-like selenium metabolism protein YedF [Synergistota bacterium]
MPDNGSISVIIGRITKRRWCVPLEIVDARGKPCPTPVMMAKQIIESGSTFFEMLVDNDISASNVKRFLESRDFVVTVAESAEGIKLVGSRPSGMNEIKTLTDTGRTDGSRENIAVVLISPTLGGPDPVLGEVLMKGFLGTLAEREQPPAVVALMNGAVKLTLADSSASDYLKILEERGTRVLVCGTCTKHFGVTEQVSTGIVSNMFEITEAVTGTSKRLTLG